MYASDSCTKKVRCIHCDVGSVTAVHGSSSGQNFSFLHHYPLARHDLSQRPLLMVKPEV